MKFVLEEYIIGQLEMKMLPEVREKILPGIYSIFNTTTEVTRGAISSGLDASGRAVFARLYADWRRFERLKGN